MAGDGQANHVRRDSRASCNKGGQSHDLRNQDDEREVAWARACLIQPRPGTCTFGYDSKQSGCPLALLHRYVAPFVLSTNVVGLC